MGESICQLVEEGCGRSDHMAAVVWVEAHIRVVSSWNLVNFIALVLRHACEVLDVVVSDNTVLSCDNEADWHGCFLYRCAGNFLHLNPEFSSTGSEDV